MGKVRWTKEAEVWLRDIHNYIARDNPAAAQRTVQRIYEKAKLLEEHPEMPLVFPAGSGGEPIGLKVRRFTYLVSSRAWRCISQALLALAFLRLPRR